MTGAAAGPTLSLCMIVKNEAGNLERCLKSVQTVVDEMIVVDTGSTDQTVEIAQAYGAKVLQHPWQADFALARNVGLEQATGDWILHLDADEALEPGSRQRIKSVLAACKAEGLKVCVRNFNPASALAAYFDSPQERLFCNRAYHRYEQPIHELILPSIWRHGGKVAESDLVIWHYGYMQPTVQGEMDRVQRNQRILEQAAAQTPHDAGHCARLGFSYYQLGNPLLAYTYLRHALLDLDCSRFTPDFLERVLCTLWEVASAQQDSKLAGDCARALQALRAQETLSVNVTYVLAHTYLRAGKRGLETALTEAQAVPEALERLQLARQTLQQAGDYFLRLRQHPQLNAAAVEKAEAGWRECQASSTAAAELMETGRRQLAAAETLRQLLEADEVAQVLRQQAGIINPDVLALVRAKAKAARVAADETLSEKLDALARQIEAAGNFHAVF